MSFSFSLSDRTQLEDVLDIVKRSHKFHKKFLDDFKVREALKTTPKGALCQDELPLPNSNFATELVS